MLRRIAGNWSRERFTCQPLAVLEITLEILVRGDVFKFKAFAMRGNVLDMAVGIIIGAAFGRITSFVSDVIMPPLGLAIGKVGANLFLNPLSRARNIRRWRP